MRQICQLIYSVHILKRIHHTGENNVHPFLPTLGIILKDTFYSFIQHLLPLYSQPMSKTEYFYFFLL